MIGRTNVGGGSGGLNVFAQLAEPSKKEGIWIKTDVAKFKYNKVELIENEMPDTYTQLTDIPYDFTQGSAIVIDTDVYLLGGTNTQTRAYKYNLIKDTYTQLTNIPYDFYGYGNPRAVAIGTDIYIFGSNDTDVNYMYRKYAYKYDTLTDTYTKLTNIPYYFYCGSAVAIGTDVYLFGCSSSINSGGALVYKYDTLTDTYTKLTSMPYQIYCGSAVAIDTNVYLFGGISGYTTAYKYDTLTDNYTKLTDIPYDFSYGSAVAIDTDVYLMGSNKSGYNQTAYKYDTLTDTYTQLNDIPYSFVNGSAVVVDAYIYLFNNTMLYKYISESNFINDNLYINIAGIYKTLLNTLIEVKILNAFIYKDNIVQNYPVYIGDGTKWNLIES